jgi:HKD family nuclease
MKLISTNDGLKKELSRLIRVYPEVAFAVAWASAETAVFKQLCAAREKIQKGVIGTHFYQTHPDVLDQFVRSKSVRFKLQPSGVFHPKIYLFWSDDYWEAIVGSANLTRGAMEKNSEVSLLISSEDAPMEMRRSLLKLIEGYWEKAEKMSVGEAARYRNMWLLKKPTIDRLSGRYGSNQATRPPTKSKILSLSWKDYVAEVRKDSYHGFVKRCALLANVRKEFESTAHFSSMPMATRLAIAGLPNKLEERWGWFGSMQGAGLFFKAIKQNDIHISRALDNIPMKGFVSKYHYAAYIKDIKKASFIHGIGTVSRLLALKRPDQFVCIDGKNKKAFCEDVGIKQNALSLESYWDEVVERVVGSPWWQVGRPSQSAVEASIWDGRAAMVDAIFYEE